MALDLYQRLGLKRGATDAEIKKAYRSLAKQLHPDRNQDKPDAAKRFAEVTQAYDVLSDKDKHARYDRGEIDEDGNPRMPFGSGYGGGGPGGGGSAGFSPDGRQHPGAGFDQMNFGGGEADLNDLFEGLFSGSRGRQGGGFRKRGAPPPQKGADVAYRLKIGFIDAVTLTAQRITLADGKTIDVKLPKGLEYGTKIRLGGKGRQGPAGPGDAIVAIEIANHPFYTRDGQDIRLTLPVTLKEAVLGAKVKVPTPEGPVMMSVPKGSSTGKVLRLKGRGFTGKDGKRGDQLISLAVDIPENNADLQKFAEDWTGGGNPRSFLGV